ncbi:MAG TPA: outer membrane protein assembly factor BamA [Candidatus Polarisedimenticolaceae bacterium]|nr:outer membrane protein assembly factor BamA [Candidatus Polarisedimenticolaceae bacterium]
MRPSQRRRVVVALLFAVAALAVAAGVWCAAHADAWARRELETRLSQALGGPVTFGQLRVRLLRLAVEFERLEARAPGPDGKLLHLVVAGGRVRLAWSQLARPLAGRLRLAELILDRPELELERSFFQTRRGDAAPLDLRIDRLDVRDGRLHFEDQEQELDFRASDVELNGSWSRRGRVLLAQAAMSVELQRTPFVRPLALQVRTGLRWRGRQLGLSSLHADGSGLHLQAEAELRWEDGWLVRGTGRLDAELERWRGLLRPELADVAGQLGGRFEFSQGPGPLQVDAELQAQEPRFRRLAARRASAELTYRERRIELRRIATEGWGGTTAGSAEVELGEERASFRARLEATRLDGRTLLELVGSRLPLEAALSGPVELAGDTRGLPALSAYGRFVAAAPAAGEGETITGAGTFQLERGLLAVDAERAVIADAALAGKLRLDLLAVPRSGSLDLACTTADAAATQRATLRLVERLGLSAPDLARVALSGQGNVRTRIEFARAAPVVLELDLTAGSWGAQEFDRLALALEARPGQLQLSHLQLEHGERRLAGSLSLRTAPWSILAAELSARRIEATELLPTLGLALDLEGAISGELHVGAREPGAGAGTLVIEQGRLRGERFERFEAGLQLEPTGTIEFSPARVSGPGFELAGHGTWELERQAGRARIEQGELRLAEIDRLRDRGLGVEARVVPRGELEFSASGLRGRLELSAQDVRVQQQPLGTVGGELVIEADTLRAHLEGPAESPFRLDGTVGLAEPYALHATLDLQRTVLDLGRGWLPVLVAEMTGRLEIDGELEHPEALRVEGRLEALGLDVGERRVQNAGLVPVGVSGGTVTFGPLRLVGRDFQVDSVWTYDLARGTIEGQAEGQADLAALASLSPRLRGAGSARLDIHVTGTARQPQFSGSLAVDGGRVRWLGYPGVLEGLSGRIQLDGGRATIDGLRGVLGGGEVRASGWVELTPVESARAELTLELDTVRLRGPGAFEGLYQGRLELNGTPQHARLSGQLELLRGVYERDFDLAVISGRTREYAAEPELPADVDLDVRVVADSGLIVRNNLAKLEARADLQLRGSLDAPEVTGRIDALEGGTLTFRDVQYDVQSASVEFLELGRFEPYVTLRATTHVNPYDIVLRVEGSLDRLDYELTSTPPLPPQDIIALLATGRTLSDLSATNPGAADAFTSDVAANYFGRALTDPFARRLRKLTGLERVQIEPLFSAGDPTARVTLGKEVRDDLLVLFSSELDSSERRAYEVEWRASRKLRVNAGRDVSGGNGGGIEYTNQFWWRRPQAAAEPAVLPAEPTPPAARVAALRIVGLSPREQQAWRERNELKVGDEYRRGRAFQVVESLRRHLVREGKLEARVELRARERPDAPGQVEVELDVQPGRTVEIRFLGVGRRDERRLRRRLEELWAGAVLGGDLLPDAEEAVREYYQGRGYYTADVQRQVEDASEQLRRVTFVVDPGRAVRVAELRIEGAQEIAAERVRRQMITRPSALFAEHTLDPSVLEQDVAAVRALYREEGYLQARIDPPQIQLSTAGESAVVTLHIEEGPRFTVGAVEFPGELPIAREQLTAWSGLTVGEPFSPARLLQAESALRLQIDAAGYPEVRLRSRTALEASAVQVSFAIEPGPLRRVAAIDVRGNVLTARKVILRELELAPGDPLSQQALLRSQHKLYRLGLFRTVELKYRPLDGPDPADQRLEVRVEDAPPLHTAIGLGYDTESGPKASVALSHENLNGRGRHLGIQAQASSILERLALSASAPRLFGDPYPTLLTLAYERREEVGFTVRSNTAAMRVDRKFGPHWKGYARYGFQRVDLFDVTDPQATFKQRLVNGRLGDVGVAAVRDTRDDPFSATRGTYLSASLRVFAKPLLSEAEFLKATLSAGYALPLGRGLSFASAARLGLEANYGADDPVPLSELFFAGGDSTLRGFARDEVGPGEALLVLNEELRMPLWRSLRGVVFYDVGNVFEQPRHVSLGDLRHVLGAGLRLETPIGPIRLEYGHKLDRQPGESHGELFLSIGPPF